LYISASTACDTLDTSGVPLRAVKKRSVVPLLDLTQIEAH